MTATSCPEGQHLQPGEQPRPQRRGAQSGVISCRGDHHRHRQGERSEHSTREPVPDVQPIVAGVCPHATNVRTQAGAVNAEFSP